MAMFILFKDNTILFYSILIVSVIIIAFLLLFFRKSNRQIAPDEHIVLAPADGKVVVVEEVEEDEFFHEKRIQVSIFMSIWNVHINWFPVSGEIQHYRYHPGKYLVARHPKSSVKNERNTIIINNSVIGKILVRQIAGTVARRIISYAKENLRVTQGDELGFIRFGSRVDLLLPPDLVIHVKPGDAVRGLKSRIASCK